METLSVHWWIFFQMQFSVLTHTYTLMYMLFNEILWDVLGARLHLITSCQASSPGCLTPFCSIRRGGDAVLLQFFHRIFHMDGTCRVSDMCRPVPYSKLHPFHPQTARAAPHISVPNWKHHRFKTKLPRYPTVTDTTDTGGGMSEDGKA